jgi:AcrR family transcriptional regulator
MKRVKAKQTVDSKRRNPQQDRAKETISAIFEATARILEREGRRALNTNSIAERAGVSIGTLYQYFPNKEAILIAMAREQIERDGRAVLEALETSGPVEPERAAVRALIAAYEKRRESRRIAVDTLVAEGLGHERAKSLRVVAETIAARSDFFPARSKPHTSTEIFVITRAVNGVLRATIEEAWDLLDTRAFEDELVKLVRGYLYN